MITNLLSVLLGVLLTIFGFLFLESYKSNEWIIGAWTNFVIAAATVVAVFLHKSALNHQRNERVWSLQKDILLKLSHSLSEMMVVTSKHVDNEFMVMQNLEQANPIEGNGTQFKDFSKSIRESLFVYRPLLSKELIEAIELYEKTDDQIEQNLNDNALTAFEAYDQLHEAQKKLHESLSTHIKSTAGM